MVDTFLALWLMAFANNSYNEMTALPPVVKLRN